jgi:Uma2 family endonuclease
VQDALLKPLLASPALPDYVGEMNRLASLEKTRRERFYDELTEDGKFEFINGRVVRHSPALDRHTLALHHLNELISNFVRIRRLGIVRIEKALCVFPRNDHEPDIVFFGPKKARLIGPDTLKYPVPDFIVEVLSPSTEKLDRGVKFEDYALHGVAEYWIVDPARKSVERHLARAGRHAKARPQKSGTIEAEVVAGFSIPVKAIFDEAENLACLRKLLA